MNKILIIDDDRELCALIKRSVQTEHIEADFCNTGKEGLQKSKEQEYQLVVPDVCPVQVLLNAVQRLVHELQYHQQVAGRAGRCARGIQ